MADTSDSHHEFQKVLRLLHSRAKDSADILKAMLDEVLRNRSKPDQKPSLATTAAAKTSVIKGMETSVIKSSSDYKRDNVSQFETNLKRFDTNFDKYRSESFEYPMDRKRQRLDSPQQTSRSTTSSPQPVGAVSGLQLPAKVQSLPVIDEYQFTDTVTTPTAIHTMASTMAITGGAAIKVEDDSETDIEDENTDAGEFAVEMGLACVHCKQIDIAPNNQLVECQECHNLYHQECHRPPLLDRDISDPRFVWYCAKCQKTMTKKIAVKPKSGAKATAAAPVAAPAVAQMKEYSLPKPLAKGDSGGGGGGADTSTGSGISRLIQPFKREHKVPVPGQPTGAAAAAVSAKPIGLAALANISRSGSVGSGVGAVSAVSGAKKTGNGNNGGSGGVITASQTSAAAADKRLQSLKKKSSKK